MQITTFFLMACACLIFSGWAFLMLLGGRVGCPLRRSRRRLAVPGLEEVRRPAGGVGI